MQKPIFNTEKIIHKALKIATMGFSADEILDKIIAYIGEVLLSDRCYIFEQIADNISNTFEWTANGIEPQIDNLQNLPIAEIEEWYRKFKAEKKVVIPNIEDIKNTEPYVYNTLKAQDIKSVVTLPLIDNGEIVGFYGVDNPPLEYLSQIVELLETLSFFVVSELRRKRMEAHDYSKLLDAMYTTGIFVITEKEHKILYFNEKIKQHSPNIKVGDICNNVWSGACVECPLRFIEDKKSYTCVNCNTPFGVSVDITATKYLWQNKIPSYIMQVTPHTDSLDEHEAKIRGIYIDVMNDMFFKSVLVDLDTGNYESFFVASHSSDFADSGVYNELVYDQSKIVDESYREDILKACSFEALKSYFEKGNRKFECIYRTNRTDGFTWLRCIASICPDTYSEKKYMIVMIENVTEAKEKEMKAERALKSALNQAKAASIAKTTFLSNMSHDIRTPMNAILGYASIAASHIEDSKCVMDSIKKILTSGEHLQSIINDILDMSRIESGKVTVNLNKVLISKLIRDSLHIIQPQVQSKQQNLFVDTMDIKNEIVWMDITKMRQVLVNILGNAVKFTDVGGKISVKIIQKESREKDYARYTFKIKDTGIGIKQDFINKIFDAFEQEHTSALGGTIGTGLGMAISKNLVEMMGGTINVESEEGKGSEFIINLELKIEENIQTYNQLEGLKGRKVLVVDDDFQVCENVAHMFKKVGIYTDWTTTAKDALLRSQIANADKEEYFAYIIDWAIPDMKANKLTKKIRKLSEAKAPIIIMTENYFEDIEKSAKDAGATSLCIKPLFISDLAEILLPQASIKSTENATFFGETILLVEDNELNTEIAVFLLKEIGFNVQTAENGKVALDMLLSSEKNYFQYVLMDIQMPVMDGFETAKRIRESDREDLKNIPIIAVTANAFKEDAEACYKAGMNEHLAKPFKKGNLINVLSRVKNTNH